MLREQRSLLDNKHSEILQSLVLDFDYAKIGFLNGEQSVITLTNIIYKRHTTSDQIHKICESFLRWGLLNNKMYIYTQKNALTGFLNAIWHIKVNLETTKNFK